MKRYYIKVHSRFSIDILITIDFDTFMVVRNPKDMSNSFCSFRKQQCVEASTYFEKPTANRNETHSHTSSAISTFRSNNSYILLQS